jgi:hypothetical protein
MGIVFVTDFVATCPVFVRASTSTVTDDAPAGAGTASENAFPGSFEPPSAIVCQHPPFTR